VLGEEGAVSFNKLYEMPSPVLDESVLLAHYTSIESVMKIVASEEIWMSHPRFMNDWQELYIGIQIVADALLSTTNDHHMVDAYREAVTGFVQLSHHLDTYAFCFSEHEKDNEDGMLSMWRGYGDHGRGACIVFNTKFMKPKEQGSILYVQPVDYLSDSERLRKAVEIVKVWVECKSDPNIDVSYIGREFDYLLDKSLFYALWTKHRGFREEREVRLGYFSFRDHRRVLYPYRGYHVGRRGVELKLKLPIAPLPEDSHRDWSFEDIVEMMIVGPAYSSELARSCLCRAFDNMGKQWLAEKVVASSIPFRTGFG
jgi:hypothetical protein